MLEENLDKVSNLHPQYAALQGMRQTVQTVFGGTLKMRAGGERFLPKFPEELTDEYQKRLGAATLLNLYKRCVNLISGLVFKAEIEMGADVPSQLTTLAENVDKKGNHLNVFAEAAFKKSLEGCAVIQIDAPVWDENTIKSAEDAARLDLSPYWILWDADSVINWSTRVNPVSNRTELDLIVFKEVKQERAGLFRLETAVYYRVLYLDEASRAAWIIFREEKDPNTAAVVVIVEKARGVIKVRSGGRISYLSSLPVSVIGELGAEPPLLDFALVNIKHYQKESGFDSLEFQAAVPLFFTKGYDSNEDLPVGANIHYKLPLEGEIGWAQIDSGGFDSMRATLSALVEQMALIGLAMLTDKTAKVDITATQAILDNISETSELRVRATNLKDALERAFGITAEYLGLGQDAGGSLELGTAWKAVETEVEAQKAAMGGKGQSEIV